MSGASDEDPEPLGFRVLPRWVDGRVALIAAPAFAILGALSTIAAVVLAVLAAGGRFSIDWLPGIVGIFGFGVICLVLYGGAHRRIVISDVPAGVPRDRLFVVSLPERGGWLRRYIEPTTKAFLVIGEEGIRLRWRRPMHYFSLGCVVLVLASHLKHVGVKVPFHLLFVGFAAWCALGLASVFRRHDHRFPWADVISVSAGANRFHLRVADEEWPDGILVEVPAGFRARVAELFAARTLFHEEVE